MGQQILYGLTDAGWWKPLPNVLSALWKWVKLCHNSVFFTPDDFMLIQPALKELRVLKNEELIKRHQICAHCYWLQGPVNKKNLTKVKFCTASLNILKFRRIPVLCHSLQMQTNSRKLTKCKRSLEFWSSEFWERTNSLSCFTWSLQVNKTCSTSRLQIKNPPTNCENMQKSIKLSSPFFRLSLHLLTAD